MVEFVDFSLLALQLTVVIFLCESITETVKAVLKDKVKLPANTYFYVALVVGILSAILLKISLFETQNLVIFYVGSILAGALASRGSNYVHDVLVMLASLRKK